MPIRAETKDGVSLLHIEGDMTIYTAAELKAELMPHLSPPVEMEIDRKGKKKSKVSAHPSPPMGREIDLSGVSEIDSAGLQLLLLAKREAERYANPLRLTGHSRAVLEVLDLCNLAGYFGDPVLIFRDTKR